MRGELSHPSEIESTPATRTWSSAVPADSRRWKECPEAVSVEIREEIARLIRDLAPYKRPSKIYVHAGDLPRTHVDTIRRLLVREWLDQLDCRASS